MKIDPATEILTKKQKDKKQSNKNLVVSLIELILTKKTYFYKLEIELILTKKTFIF